MDESGHADCVIERWSAGNCYEISKLRASIFGTRSAFSAGMTLSVAGSGAEILEGPHAVFPVFF
jgi:hypothetical protein